MKHVKGVELVVMKFNHQLIFTDLYCDVQPTCFFFIPRSPQIKANLTFGENEKYPFNI